MSDLCCSASTSAPRPARPRWSTPTAPSSRHGQAPDARGGASPTGAEIDPDALFDAALAAARRARSPRAPAGRVRGIGVTGMAETGVLLDGARRAARPAIAWHDARGGDEARRLARELGERGSSARTGLPATALCTRQAPLAARPPARRRGAARAGSTSASGSCAASAATRSPSCRWPRATGLLDLRAKRPYADALAWAGLPGGPPARAASLAGTPAGRQRRRRAPRAPRAPSLTVAATTTSPPASGSAWSAPGDVLDSCGTAEASSASWRRRWTPTRSRRASRAARASAGTSPPAARRCSAASGPASRSGRSSTRSASRAEAGRDELDAGALATAPGDAPALELDLRALERPPLRLPDGVAPAAVWRATLDAVAARGRRQLAHLDAVAGPRRAARRHRRLGARRGRARGQGAPRADRDAAASSRPAAAAPRSLARRGRRPVREHRRRCPPIAAPAGRTA